MTDKRLSIKDMALCSLFTVLIAAGAFIKIPLPGLPFTLQTLFTTLAGLLLGKRLGLFSVCAYIILGLMGLPVFTAGGGIGYIFQPSFGYLIGFAVGTWVTGDIANRTSFPSLKRLYAASLSGLFFVYAFGMAYYWLISNFYLGADIGLRHLFLYCFLLTLPGDLALCSVSVALGRRLIPVLRTQLQIDAR